MEQCEGAADHEVCENFLFLCLFILIFLFRHRLASLVLDPQAGLFVAPSPSPAALRSRSQATLKE